MVRDCKMKIESCKLEIGRRRRLSDQFAILNSQFSIFNSSSRRGFTLIELMVVLVVLLIVGLLGFTFFNSASKADLTRGGARNAQSFLEGARDRAIHDNLPRGVRFLRSPNDPNVIDRMVYIGPAGILSEGEIQIDATSMRQIVFPDSRLNVLWDRLVTRGLITTGNWLTLKNGGNIVGRFAIRVMGQDAMGMPLNPKQYFLTKNAPMPLGTNLEYELHLGPSILPNQEPRQLPGKVLIDIQRSRFGDQPLSAVLPAGAPLDVIFSPRGTIVGNAAQAGRIQLVVRSLGDYEERPTMTQAEVQDNENPTLVVVITTQTGSVSAHELSDLYQPDPMMPNYNPDPAGVESD